MKIAICFGLIMGALISICNMCFAAVETELSFDSESGLYIDANGVIGSQTPENYVFYILLEKGKTYKFVPVGSHRGAFYEDISIGSVGTNFDSFTAPNEYTLTPSDDIYLTFAVWGPSSGIGSIYLIDDGMGGFVDNLAYDLSYANLSGVLFFVVPIMAISILFSLGLYLLKRLLNKIKRAKGGA